MKFIIDPEGQKFPRMDFHMHTDWTDGRCGIADMFAAAQKERLNAILFSEHVRDSSWDWFQNFAKQVRELPQQKCRTHLGCETRIVDTKGTLDVSGEILAAVDFVIASVHRFPGSDGAAAPFGAFSPREACDIEYRLSCAALDNPNVDILGHPFGMTLKRYAFMPPDDMVISLIKKAADCGVAFDINASYHPDPERLLTWCDKYGATISLGSDAHDAPEVGRILRILEGKESPCDLSKSSSPGRAVASAKES